MLCTMCCHGVSRDQQWRCPCGEWHCTHIWECDACRTLRVNRPLTLAEHCQNAICIWCTTHKESADLVVIPAVLTLTGDDTPNQPTHVYTVCRDCYRELSQEQRGRISPTTPHVG